MRSHVISAASAVAASLFAAGAAPGAGAQDEAGALEPLAFLAGSCWRGTFPDGAAEDEHCFTWMMDGLYLRDRHVVTGAGEPYEGESIYHRDAESGAIVYRYWASSGGVSDGAVEIGADGALSFPEERHVAPDGTASVYRSHFERVGPDAYLSVTEVQTSDGWSEAWRMAMARSRPAEAE